MWCRQKPVTVDGLPFTNGKYVGRKHRFERVMDGDGVTVLKHNGLTINNLASRSRLTLTQIGVSNPHTVSMKSKRLIVVLCFVDDVVQQQITKQQRTSQTILFLSLHDQIKAHQLLAQYAVHHLMGSKKSKFRQLPIQKSIPQQLF